MSPDDPRHGSVAGSRAGCQEQCCAKAINRYHQILKLEHMSGAPSRLVPVTGTRRRVEALQWLGWSAAEISRRLGRNPTWLTQTTRKHAVIRRETAEAVARVYDGLSMRLPNPATQSERLSVGRTQALARRRGYAPPLAWDDIDNDDRPAIGATGNAPDEAVILRVLAGENLPTTTAERREIMRRWLASGRTQKALCDRMGWKEGRYVTRDEEAA